jgi:hypothetical protein
MASPLRLKMPLVRLIKPPVNISKIGMYDPPEIDYTEEELEQVVTITEDFYE